MRTRDAIGRIIAAAGLALALAGVATPALAETPRDLQGEFLVDDAGVLSADAAASIQESLDELFADTDVTLRIVYVETFDSPSSATAWADETARLTGLGADDVLLAIATVDRNYAYSVDSGFPLTNAQLDEIAADRLVPELRNNDWAAGGSAFTQGVRDALLPGPPWLAIGGGALALGVGGFYTGRAIVRWRRRKRDVRKAQEALEAHQERVDAMLVELDDSIKTSRQEIGFAAAQFGEDATVDFRHAWENAQRLLSDAFAARHALDVDRLSGPQTRRKALDEIAALCEKADAALDEQADAFERLRALEKEAPNLREELLSRQPQLAAAIASVRAVDAELEQRFGVEATATVEGSVAQAERLAAFVQVELQRAGEAIEAGASGVAAVRIRSAQQAVGQIDELVESVPALAKELTEAASALQTVLVDTHSDIAEARAVVLDDSRDAAELTAAAAAAEQAIADLPASPIDALAAAEKANAALAAVQGRVQDRAIQRDRAVAHLATATEAARQALQRTGSFIQTRRGIIGPSARSALAAAEKDYAAALASAAADDPIAALAAALKASDGAASAQRTARADIARHNRPRYERDDDEGAGVGGILGWLFGEGDGGGSSSGWSSSSRSSWSSSSRSRSSGRSSSRSRSSSSSRRSGGSRSSSSRRSGGGRF